MGKYSGKSILLFINGQEVACQKDLTISVDRNLFPTTDKQDSDWETHGNGTKKSSVPFSALQSTTGFSGTELFDMIIGAASALLVINGFAYPYAMEVDLQNSSITAPSEEAVTLQGTFVANGKIYRLSGDNAQLLTDPDATINDYDTLTHTGTKITSAINLGLGANLISNSFSVTEDDVIKVALFLTKTSGQLPSVQILKSGTYDEYSNKVQLVEGMNFVTLIVTATGTAHLCIDNTDAANFSTSNIYCFKDN